MKGQTVLAFSPDPVTAPKVAVDFAKVNEKLVILGGAMGTTSLDANGVKALATLPSLDQLRAKLVGMLQSPATRVASDRGCPGGPARPGRQGIRRQEQRWLRHSQHQPRFEPTGNAIMADLVEDRRRAVEAHRP